VPEELLKVRVELRSAVESSFPSGPRRVEFAATGDPTLVAVTLSPALWRELGEPTVLHIQAVPE
jgi:hypothetical protein